MTSNPRSLVAALPALAALLLAGAASGQTQDGAAAQSLFDEGRALLDAGKADAACAKFEASLRLEPAVGSLLNVAACDERHGRLASAWARYRAAESLATARGDARAAVAAKGAASLGPRLGKVRVRAPKGVSVRRDGVVLDEALLGTEVPTDAGEHVFEASAPGKGPWRATMETKDGETTDVTVPELPPALDAPVTPPPVGDARGPAEGRPSSPIRTVGLGMVGVGVAGLVTWGVLGGLALAKHGEVGSRCRDVGGTPVCDAEGKELNDDAVDLANAATVALIAGGALVSAGGLLFFLSPSPSHRRASLVPQVGARATAHGAGLRAGWTF